MDVKKKKKPAQWNLIWKKYQEGVSLGRLSYILEKKYSCWTQEVSSSFWVTKVN